MSTTDGDPTTDEHSTTADEGAGEHLPGVPDRSALPGEPRTGTAAELQRRDYLKAVGAAGLAGSLAGASSGTAAAQGDWESEADARIEEHRTGELEVVVRNRDGQAVPDADVSVEMQEHEFGFGVAVDANELRNASEDDPYRRHIPELFNKAVLENAHKWRFWEDDPDTADWATDWLLEQGLTVRGHTCVWGATQHSAVPSDVETAIDNRDEQTIRERTMEHIETIISHYGDDVEEWEVVNEALHEHALQVGVYGDQIDQDEPWNGEVVPWTSELLADWYLHAQEVADQYDVGVSVNDFNTLGGDWPYARDWYPAQIEHLLDSGVDLAGIGFQSHIAARTNPVGQQEDGNPDERMSYSQINDVLDLYADYDAGLRITEFDTYEGDDWSGDEEKADALYTYLKTAFAHPAVDDFLLWGFWDGNHWQDDAPLFYRDWSEKPAYDVWTGLVFDEWWTSVSGTTDASGTYATSAFLGEHAITVSTDRDETTEVVSVTDADGTTRVEVTVDGEGSDGHPDCADDVEDVAVVDGRPIADVDGDGLYRDFTCDGQVTQTDVVEWFKIQHRPPWKDPRFDFTGNGDVGHADVVELFEYVATQP